MLFDISSNFADAILCQHENLKSEALSENLLPSQSITAECGEAHDPFQSSLFSGISAGTSLEQYSTVLGMYLVVLKSLN